MNYSHHRADTFSVASLTTAASEIVVAYISVDIHTSMNATQEATELLYADALLSGAGTMNRAAFLNAVNSLGASISINLSEGELTITLKAQATVLKPLLKLVETMLLAPSFPVTELKRIKQTVHNALHESKEDSKSIAQQHLRNVFYGIHDRRYSYNIDTLQEKVKGVSVKDIRTLHAKVLRGFWHITAAGNEASLSALTSTTKRIKKGNVLSIVAPHHTQNETAGALILSNIPSRQNIDFSIGLPLPITLHHPDCLPLVFGIAVLGKWGGFTGRLMSTVREKEGLTYGIYGRLEGMTGHEQGYFRIMTFFSPAQSLQGLTATFREIKKIHDEGITEEEFLRFKNILQTQEVLKSDSLLSQVMDLHSYHTEGFSIEDMKLYKEKAKAITRDEVNMVLAKYLNPKKFVVSGAGPTAGVEKSLRAFFKTVS